MKYDVKEWKIESAYDPTRHVVNFLTLVQLQYVYGKIGRACCTVGNWIFDENFPKALPFPRKSLKIISNDCNNNDIDK